MSEASPLYDDLHVRSIRIAAEYGAGKWAYVAKIIPYGPADGGFAIIPQGNLHYGQLARHRTRDTFSHFIGPTASVIEQAKVSSRAKVSFHPDGFTQFSSIDRGAIVSGPDRQGWPIGFNIRARPFSRPVSTGGIVSLTFWGLSHLPPIAPALADVQFSRQILRTVPPVVFDAPASIARRGIVLEGYLLKEPFGRIVNDLKRPSCVINLWDGILGRQYPRFMRIVRLHSRDATLLLGARIAQVEFQPPAGISISTQRDENHVGLFAMFTKHPHGDKGRSLDRVAPSIHRTQLGSMGLLTLPR